MSLYLMPITIQNRLESMRNRFFIGGDRDDKKMTWVKWKTCLASKAMGGLGIGSIYGFNVALLFKWVWRFRNNSNVLWVNVIKEIYGQDGGFGSDRIGKSSYSPWYSIYHLVSTLRDKGIDLLGMCNRSVGNGSTTSFWGDSWCGGRPLKDQYPRVYALDLNKSCSVADRMGIKDWSSVLRRTPRGGAESNQFADLIQSIQQVTLTSSADAWKWELSSSGFSVVSTRQYVDDQTLLGSLSSTRWVRCIPIKVNVFIWKLRLGKLPTLVNMDRRGIDVDSLLCPICKENVECVDHLFFLCGMAKDLWGLLARWCSLDFPELSSTQDWYTWLDASPMSKCAKIIIEGVAATLMWSIWNFRNAWIFSMSKPNKATMWDNIVHQSFLWISSRNPKYNLSWIDWLGNPINTHTM